MSTPTIERVNIRPETVEDFHTGERYDRYIVTPIWAGVDRPNSTGYSCGKKLALAKRLAKAFREGACYSDAKVKRDVYGQTYVSYDFNIRMRAANADLKKIGY